MKRRLGKAARKARAIAHLSQVCRQARILSRTGHRPTLWGVEGQGLAPTTLRKLRAQVAAMSMCRHPGGRSTTAIRLAFSAAADPLVGLRRQLLQEWVRLWRSGLVPTAAVERAWPRLLAGLQAARSRWGKTKGPISAVISTRMDIGWRPRTPESWEDPDGVVFDIVEGDPDQLIDFELTGSLDQAAWEQAAQHHPGEGLWQGADLTVPKRHLQGLRRQGRPGDAAMLEMVATGSLWPAARRHGSEAGRARPPQDGAGDEHAAGEPLA